MAFVREAVRAGAGIGLLPMLLVQADLDAGRLVRLLPRHWLKLGTLNLVYPAARHLPPKTTAFRDFIVAELKARPLGSRAE
jgi:DNA-binding transcriptional LysR family regulator